MNEEEINLPSRFKQLEYLESETSTSGAYAIDTGIKPNQNTGFWIDYNEVSDNASNFQQAIFGARHASMDKELQLTHHQNGILRFNNTSYPANFNLCTRYQVSLRNRVFTHYDGTQTVLPDTEWQCDYNIHLFCLNNAGTLFQGGATKVYRFKIYDGDTLVRDFIPVYDRISSVPCMFDLVTQTPFYNKGNEELLYSEIEEVINLPYGYKQCLFLESTGTQYINTNYVATNNTGAYVKWSLTNIKNYSNVLACLGISTDDTADNIFMLPHWNGDNNAYLCGFKSRASGALRLENQTAPTLQSIHESYLNYHNNGQALIDTTLLGSVDNVSENLENDLPLYLFGCNKLNSLSTNDSMIGRIYRAIITEGENIVMDLIPCLDDMGKPCMYDLISNSQTPFYNANVEGDDFKYVVKGKIPTWYKRLKYLESTGTQYIDTGIVTDGTYTITAKLRGNNVGGTNDIWGRREVGGESFARRFKATYWLISFYYAWAGQISEPQLDSAQIHDYIVTEGQKNIIVDGKNFSLNALNTYGINASNPSRKTHHLFASNGGSKGQVCFYSFRMQNGEGKVVLDFVPALDENGKPCMFDLVEGIPYYNAGTGEFKCPPGSLETDYKKYCTLGVIGNRLGTGEDGLPPTYKRVNYLESTGTQYIDTGIVTDGTYTISTKFCINEIRGNHGIWGRNVNNSTGSSYAGAFKPSTYALFFSNHWSGGLYDWAVDIFQPHEYIVTEGQKNIIVDGETKALKGLNTNAVNSSNPYNLPHYLFRGNTMYSFVSFYNFRIQNGEGKVVLDFVPALDENDRPCMFDRISNKTFYNQGTGEFLYG